MDKENKKNKKKNINVECANEFASEDRKRESLDNQIEQNSHLNQERMNYEFARDNYLHTNGNINNLGNQNMQNRGNSSYELDSLRDKQLEEGFEYEFGDDLYETSNNVNNQRNQSNTNDNRNTNENRNKNQSSNKNQKK